MVISKRLIILLLGIAILAAGLFTMIDRTYAYTNVIATSSGNLKISLSKVTDANNRSAITDGSDNTIFDSDLIWEPGSMHAVTLVVKNTAESTETDKTFEHWLYPYAAPVANSKNQHCLGDVLEAYLYLGEYNTSTNGRPKLTDGNWISLGTIGNLSSTNPPASSLLPAIELKPGGEQAYTLVLKMSESADNDYQGAEANIFVYVKADSLINSIKDTPSPTPVPTATPDPDTYSSN